MSYDNHHAEHEWLLVDLIVGVAGIAAALILAVMVWKAKS